MSASSGIAPSESLKQSWATALNDPSVRAVKVVIRNNEMVETDRISSGGNFAQDWTAIASKLDANPAYFLIRSDTKSSTGDGFLLALYVPEATAQVRDKMLYASSRDTLKKDLGRSYFVSDYFASEPKEMSFDAYSANLNVQTEQVRDSLLTAQEVAHRQEARMEKDVSGSKDSVHGVAFALTDSARTLLQSYNSNRNNFVSVKVDVKNETIDGGDGKNVTNDSINDHISGTEAFFYFFKYDHKDKDENDATTHVFIYSCPEDVPIKHKMLASSTKGAVLSSAEAIGIKVQKRVEITDPNDFNLDDIYAELYPEAQKQKVITRAAPSARGGRRLIRK